MPLIYRVDARGDGHLIQFDRWSHAERVRLGVLWKRLRLPAREIARRMGRSRNSILGELYRQRQRRRRNQTNPAYRGLRLRWWEENKSRINARRREAYRVSRETQEGDCNVRHRSHPEDGHHHPQR